MQTPYTITESDKPMIQWVARRMRVSHADVLRIGQKMSNMDFTDPEVQQLLDAYRDYKITHPGA